MQQQWWHEFPSIALLSDTRLQTIRLKVDMWLFQLYIQRGKKQDQGSLVLCIAYIQLTLLKELHSQRFHACKFTWRNIFFLFPLCTPPQIPPIFHFWTHSLPPKWIWSIITPWLNHETELQTAGCREHNGLPRILTCGSACCVCWRACAEKNNLDLPPQVAKCQDESFSLKEFQRQCLGIGGD